MAHPTFKSPAKAPDSIWRHPPNCGGCSKINNKKKNNGRTTRFRMFCVDLSLPDLTVPIPNDSHRYARFDAWYDQIIACRPMSCFHFRPATVLFVLIRSQSVAVLICMDNGAYATPNIGKTVQRKFESSSIGNNFAAVLIIIIEENYSGRVGCKSWWVDIDAIKAILVCRWDSPSRRHSMLRSYKCGSSRRHGQRMPTRSTDLWINVRRSLNPMICLQGHSIE